MELCLLLYIAEIRAAMDISTPVCYTSHLSIIMMGEIWIQVKSSTN
jgi:hypothetical protein